MDSPSEELPPVDTEGERLSDHPEGITDSEAEEGMIVMREVDVDNDWSNGVDDE